MDPTKLIGPTNPLGAPAPFWFIEFFKVLGFILHSIPMSLWYAGIIIAMLLWRSHNEHARALSTRLMKKMPIIVAYGINLGIIPLLFTQVAYYKFFYPATILMGWSWFSIFVLLIFAYYGVYLYATGMKHAAADDKKPIHKIQIAAGWVSAVLFIVIGFIFANNFSLMTNLDAWDSIVQHTSIAGAPLGTALNTSDPTLFSRWLMMFGLAIMTTAVYIMFDLSYFAKSESEESKDWTTKFAFRLYTLGAGVYAIMGYNYIFRTLRPEAKNALLNHPTVLLTIMTAISPILPFLLLIAVRRSGINKVFTMLIALTQFLVLTLNAISRQIVQNVELKKYFDVSTEPVNLQLSPMIVFLLLFIFGLVVIIWMLTKVTRLEDIP